MIDKEKKIHERLVSDFNLLRSMGYEVIGVFLQGSQNYHLDDEQSDIDTRAIVIPLFEDFLHNCKPISTTHVLESNEHIDLKDIRLMHDCFRKQNPNYLEILFTKYKYINPEYESLYLPLLENNEKIAHFNDFSAIHSLKGMVYSRFKALEHPYPTVADKISQYGYDPKQLHHLLRFKEFLCRYINGTPFADCLIPTDPERLSNIKRNYIYSLKEARKICEEALSEADEAANQYMAERKKPRIDEEANEILDNVLSNVLKASFVKELKI